MQKTENRPRAKLLKIARKSGYKISTRRKTVYSTDEFNLSEEVKELVDRYGFIVQLKLKFYV